MVHRGAEYAKLARVTERVETIMAQQQVRAGGLEKVDPVWTRILREAEEIARREPELATFIYSTILHHDTLEAAVVHRVAERLDSPQVSAELIRQAYADALEHEPAIGDAFRADIVATVDRDPATNRFLEPVLYFKGFHAIQTHRLAHWLWGRGRKDFAYYLQSQSSAVFQTDINPAVSIGRGIFLDHATGVVVGETAVIEDDVSILQEVTLGGTGKEAGDRHPKIRRGVLIGAGAKNPRQYRDRSLRAHRRRLGRAQAGAAQHDSGRSSGEGHRRSRLPRTVAYHGPFVPRRRRLTEGARPVDVQEVRKLDAYLKRLFGNQRIRVVPKKNDSAEVFVGEEAIGSLVLDEDEEDDERSYNFEVKITLGDATTTAPDIKKLDAYLKRKFDNERIRVVPRLKKKDSAEVYVGEEYIGVLFFDEKDARSSYFELPILALDLDEPGLLKG